MSLKSAKLEGHPVTDKDYRLVVQRWLLTAATNYVQGMEPAAHHSQRVRKVWPEAKRDAIASLRAEIAKWDDKHGFMPRQDAGSHEGALLLELDLLYAANARLREQLAAYTGITETHDFPHAS